MLEQGIRHAILDLHRRGQGVRAIARALQVSRHLMRARNRAGFGWKRWSTVGLYAALGLFRDYHVRYGARA